MLPPDECTPGQLAVPGETNCHEVAPCEGGTWRAIAWCAIERARRGGHFGSAVSLTGSSLSCDVLDLVGQSYAGFSAAFEDLGSNVCGCQDDVHDCRVDEADVTPPLPLAPDR